MHADGFPPIEDYFVIGDLHTVALVSRQGSIDWLCLPDFDSPSLFSRLLDPAGGCLEIDMPEYQKAASYVRHTAVVEFRLSGNGNQLSVRDFMVPRATKKTVNQLLVRAISGIRGRVTVRFVLRPAGQYGAVVPRVQIASGRLQFSCGNGQVVLHLPETAKTARQPDGYSIEIPIEAGRKEQLLLEYIPETNPPSANQVNLEEKTLTFWRRWVDQGQYTDFRRDQLIRSAITLKLMQFYPTGAIVAAPTTSLPEQIGGTRNWDYRYVWIRDATFSLYALYVLGYDQEAERFFKFIERVTKRCAQEDLELSVMYTVWGDAVPEERQLENLSGYKNSKPVRVGNQASHQFQLDVYGSLIDAFYFVSKRELTKTDRRIWRRLVMQLVRRIDARWQKPDNGIWEARISPMHYTYSKVMAWVGADRACRLRDTLGLTDEDYKLCTELAASIKRWIWQHCYQKEAQVLAQYPQAQSVDATNLLFVLLQFLDKHDPLTKGIVRATAKELSRQKVFVYRYHGHDGLPPGEGAFWLCSFWLISALAILEDITGALQLFNELETHIASHGLIAEEYDPGADHYLGNYPQTFSHMGYIMTVYYVRRYAERQRIALDNSVNQKEDS